jgi:hypothetical protein
MQPIHLLFMAVLVSTCIAAAPAAAQATAEAAALAQAQAQARAAEARAALAEAERAELLARLPPSTSKALAGSSDVRAFGAAGLVKAFDLARQLAGEVCTALPADRRTVLYDPAASQGVLAARLVLDALERLDADLVRQNGELQAVIDAHAPQGAQAAALFTVLTVVPATLKAAADVAALFKTNATVDGMAYGDGARALFATALQQACPQRIGGLGSGYLGELDKARYDALLARVRRLAARQAEFANRIAIVQKLADAAKGDEKKALAAVASSAGALLKSVDAFVDSLKAGEAGDKSPLYNAARYLGYAAHTEGMLVLDIDLRLEGMSIVKDNLFTGQRVRLSGVAFLWWRLHAPDGTVLKAAALRRISRPVDVDLRGNPADSDFWEGS